MAASGIGSDFVAQQQVQVPPAKPGPGVMPVPGGLTASGTPTGAPSLADSLGKPPPTEGKLGWPDALQGLATFIAATKSQRQHAPAPNSFAGIGKSGKAGPLSAQMQAVGGLGQFL